MRKNFHTLALQVVQKQQALSCAVTRIQCGFLPLENIHTAQRELDAIKQLLLLIEKDTIEKAYAETPAKK
jgi:hypothetical protein